MEKIIVILIILTAIYYIQTKMQTTEGFEAAGQSIGGVDDANAINTLAQIARKLMTDGLKVPGNMTVDGALNIGGLAMFKGTASPDSAKMQWGDGTGWRLRFQKDDKNPIMDIYDYGAVNIINDINIGGIMNNGKGTITVGGTAGGGPPLCNLLIRGTLTSGFGGQAAVFNGPVTVNGPINSNQAMTITSPGEWGNCLNIVGGSKESPYINFMNKDGSRNGYLMINPGGVLVVGK